MLFSRHVERCEILVFSRSKQGFLLGGAPGPARKFTRFLLYSLVFLQLLAKMVSAINLIVNLRVRFRRSSNFLVFNEKKSARSQKVAPAARKACVFSSGILSVE